MSDRRTPEAGLRPEASDAATAGQPAAGIEATRPVPFWRRRPVVIAGAALGGALVLYGVAFAVAGTSLARNATVLGVEVGGLSRAEAESKLAAELPAIVDEPVAVQVAGTDSTYTIVPSEAGLTIDAAATADAVPGGSANPASLVRALFGGGEVDPVPAVDRPALDDALAAIALQADVAPVNGSVGFDAGEVVTTAAQPGTAVDVAASADAVELAFFGTAGPHELPLATVSAVIGEVPPAITDVEVERAVTEFAEPAMSGPVTISGGGHSAEIEPEMISAALTLTPEGSTLVPSLDGAKLVEQAADALSVMGRQGTDATLLIEGGRPVVVPSETGTGVVPDALSEAVLPLLTAAGDERAATVELTDVEPELTTEAAQDLGVEDLIGEATTRFPHASYRNTNIGLAARKLDNTLLLPGDTFSLNGIVGERNAANGFAVGWTISGGRLVEDFGGGVSQVATTTYHAAFKAGLEDVYHQPHSIYFDRYPIAQEATVSWGNFDMSFRNDSPHGVLVETRFTPSTPGSQGVLNVRIWSTEHFDVETSVSGRSNVTEPQTIYDTGPECEAQTGWNGFSITSYRKAWDPDGELVKDESYPWTYRPNPTVVCGPKPGAAD